MTTTQTAAESLAALLEAAPPELRTMLTRECPAGNHGMYQSLRAKDTPPRTCKICGLVGYGFSRTVLPVPEATAVSTGIAGAHNTTALDAQASTTTRNLAQSVKQ